MKTRLGLFTLSIICMFGCNNDEIGSTKEILSFIDAPYTFPNVADPTVWKTFNNMEEMLAACQIPDDVLQQISTENLIVSCMNYPLFFTYSAYNNELDGIKILMDHFNGFQEL